MGIVDNQINKAANAMSRFKDKEALAIGDALVSKQRSISGKVRRDKAEVIIIFKVGGKLYPQTEQNGELIDAYFHTGDETYLDQLTDEVPF